MIKKILTFCYWKDRQVHPDQGEAEDAAGAVIILLLVIIVRIIGGAAFSGSSESSEALSQEVFSYTATIQNTSLTSCGIIPTVDCLPACLEVI